MPSFCIRYVAGGCASVLAFTSQKFCLYLGRKNVDLLFPQRSSVFSGRNKPGISVALILVPDCRRRKSESAAGESHIYAILAIRFSGISKYIHSETYSKQLS